MDGMISDIKLDCKIILEARLNRNPDMIDIIFGALKNIVRLFQGICYLRLRNSAYGNRQDRLFFGVFLPYNMDALEFQTEQSSDMWEYIFEHIEKVGGNLEDPNIYITEILGCNLNDIRNICECYRLYLTLERIGR